MSPSTEVKKMTPMMVQYLGIKKGLPPETILFFRLGDFYEMFFEDAVKASEILNITLTGREGGSAGRIPMCGFPYHAFQGYVRSLLDQNLKVAICEQVGDPKESKGLLERKVARIITPATFLDEEVGSAPLEYILSVAKSGDNFAISCLELSTGDFFVRELAEDRVPGEMLLIGPREVILPRSLEDHELIRRMTKDMLGASLTVYEDWIFEPSEALPLFKEVLKIGSERNISFKDKPASISASGAILYYLRDHLHSAIEHVSMPRFLSDTDTMILDQDAQRSLELVSGASGRKGGLSLFRVLNQTQTLMGERVLRQWVLQPLLLVAGILERQSGVRYFVERPNALNQIRLEFKGVRDIERTVSRLNYGVANARDLINLKDFLTRVPALRQLISQTDVEILKQQLGVLIPFPNLIQLIDEAITDEPPLGVKEGGLIQDGFSAELDELRGLQKKGKTWLIDFQKKESERTGIKALKIKYSKVFGYAIEVNQSNLHLVPDDYIRRQTLAGAERFITPELKEWDLRISSASDQIKAMEFVLFDQVRKQILEELEALRAIARAVGCLDCLSTFAYLAVHKKWVCPEIEDSDTLDIEGGRHPVVESVLAQGKFVKNDLKLDGRDNQLIVLTGPNMAGKSTYIRQAALIVLLAQAGSFVPADRAKIGIVDRIFTRIGSSDNLAAGESTFMVEMVETANILQKCSSRSLLILDEVGRGTSTFDGVSIAWAICEHLTKGSIRPRTLFATHYHELTQLEGHWPGIKNFNIVVRETDRSIVFLRKIIRGAADRSYGIHVARLAGIPEDVTVRAEAILKTLEDENKQATQIIEGVSSVNKKDADKQKDLFVELSSEENKVIACLDNADPNCMTPLEALQLLAELKGWLK